MSVKKRRSREGEVKSGSSKKKSGFRKKKIICFWKREKKGREGKGGNEFRGGVRLKKEKSFLEKKMPARTVTRGIGRGKREPAHEKKTP